MKNRFRKALVWLTCAVMMMTLWTGTATAEGEKNTDFLGKPFPDFSVTDTEGKTFTLSEALKDHQAAMIVFWATWCGPCEREFPYLEEVYQKYGDRVAFIALNEEKRETEDEIKAYRAEHGLTIPMGHSEDDDLYRYIGGVYLPDTVVVDRFGNAVFFHDSAFKNPEDVARVLETFLGDDYTQTAVLKSIPGDTSTRAFPVSAARAIYPEIGKIRTGSAPSAAGLFRKAIRSASGSKSRRMTTSRPWNTRTGSWIIASASRKCWIRNAEFTYTIRSSPTVRQNGRFPRLFCTTQPSKRIRRRSWFYFSRMKRPSA